MFLQYEVTVPENEVGAVVVKMPVEDKDEPQSSAWAAKFRIVKGDTSGFFNITTGPNKQEGIITTVKVLHNSSSSVHQLCVPE